MDNTFTPMNGWAVYQGVTLLGPAVLCSDGSTCYVDSKGNVIQMEESRGQNLMRIT